MTGLYNLQWLICFGNHMATPGSVKGWQELGLVINIPEFQWTGTFLFYPQAIPTVFVGVHAPRKSGVNGFVECTLSLANAENVLAVELTFEFDGILTLEEIYGVNGFDVIDSRVLKNTYENSWRGEITLGYPAGGESEGFTFPGAADIAKLVFAPNAQGEASIVLAGAKVAGTDGTEPVYFYSAIEPSVATTSISKSYSKYDLTMDGIVDVLDRMALDFGASGRAAKPYTLMGYKTDSAGQFESINVGFSLNGNSLNIRSRTIARIGGDNYIRDFLIDGDAAVFFYEKDDSDKNVGISTVAKINLDETRLITQGAVLLSDDGKR